MSDLKSKVDEFWSVEFFGEAPFDDSLYEEMSKDPNKLLCYSYWDNGCNCCCTSKDELVGLANEMISASDDETFQVILFDHDGKGYELRATQVHLKEY